MNHIEQAIADTVRLLGLAQAETRAAAGWVPAPGEGIAELAAHLRAEDEHGHAWPVGPAEAASPAALRGMHLAAHRALVQDFRDELAELRNEMRAPDGAPGPADDEYDEYDDGSPFDAAHEAWCEEQMRLCSAEFTSGPREDPCGSMCDRGLGHAPHTPHEAADPFAGPGDRMLRVSWSGGGMCAGDPLPPRDVQYFTRPGA
jgi:hypothetical protein